MGTWVKLAAASCLLLVVGMGCGSEGGNDTGESAASQAAAGGQTTPTGPGMQTAGAQTTSPTTGATNAAPAAGAGAPGAPPTAGASGAPATAPGAIPAGPTQQPGQTTNPTGAAGPEPTPTMEPGMGPMGPNTEMVPELNPGEFPDPRGGCDLDTGWPGDDTCMAPPPAGEGMQIHIGPEDYNNVGEFEFGPGRENSECVNFTTPNDEDVYYQGWVLSGRPGTHHIINTMYRTPNSGGGSSFTLCRDGGTGTNTAIVANLPGASKPYMPRAPVAPENKNLGAMVPANTAAQADMHYFNFTDKPLLREFWLNLYYVPKEQVTEESKQVRAMGGLSWTVLPIPPGADQVYKYECPINSSGRIIQLLGHYHAHGVRFTSHLRRASGERVKIFEMYDYLEPQIFYYDSVTQNPDFSDNAPGALTGMLEVQAGDSLEWECHIRNDSSVGLRYTNAVETGEMCNLWGSAVGPNINCVVP
ncbi:MAG: hypothetical protein OXU20_12300 [Myxococcales bacterium]|nr:hypothetical protein [Myxococcales bacterium]MDD9970733.1 hypothetical protein [Myxococcales bacterium]